MKREVGWALVPYPILPPSLVSHTGSVDAVKYHGRRKQRYGAWELCEQGDGPGLSYLSHSSPVPSHTVTVSVDAEYHKKKKDVGQSSGVV